MKLLGTLALLQIQRRSLTIGTGPTRYFDPSGLLPVDELHLTPGGAFAPTADGSCVIDVHHAAHPFTRSRGENTLSFGFSRHYATMRAHFGDPFPFGCAAENLIIDGPAPRVFPADVAGGIAIETADGLATLGQVIPAPPCLPFARYALRDPEATPPAVKAAIQYIDDGLRGYYCAFVGPKTATVRLGANVYALS